MRKVMLTLLATVVAAAASAQKYTVDFHAVGAGGDLRKVYLMNAETRAMIDSFSVDHERARLEGTYAGLPVLAVVVDAPNARSPYATFILDATPTTLECQPASAQSPMGTVTLKGSAENNRLNDLLTSFNGHVGKLQEMMAGLRAAIPAGGQPTEAQLAEYREKAGAEEEALKADFQQALQSERQNKVSLYCLIEAGQLFDNDFLAKYLEDYEFANVPALKRMRDDLEAAKLRAPGAPMIDFEMADQAGTKHKLSEFVGKGKYVMVDFWASWCGPCRQEMPNVKKAYERFHDKGFDIVAVSFDNNRDAWLKGISDLGMTWTQLSDLQGWNCLAGQLYKIHAIPCTILFGPDGKVVASDLRGEALSKMLEEKLQ